MSTEIRVVKGRPTPEELAAVIAAIRMKAVAHNAESARHRELSAWGSYWHRLRQPVGPGTPVPHGWRASGLPK